MVARYVRVTWILVRYHFGQPLCVFARDGMGQRGSTCTPFKGIEARGVHKLARHARPTRRC